MRYAIAKVFGERIGKGNFRLQGKLYYQVLHLECVVIRARDQDGEVFIGRCDVDGVVSGHACGRVGVNGMYDILVQGVKDDALILIDYDYEYSLPADAGFGREDGSPTICAGEHNGGLKPLPNHPKPDVIPPSQISVNECDNEGCHGSDRPCPECHEEHVPNDLTEAVLDGSEDMLDIIRNLEREVGRLQMQLVTMKVELDFWETKYRMD